MNKLTEREIVDIAFKLLELIIIAGLIIMLIKVKDISKRVSDLERDYKIYELNLQNLEEHKDVQFE